MKVVEEIYKVASIALSPNVSAQIFVSQKDLKLMWICICRNHLNCSESGMNGADGFDG